MNAAELRGFGWIHSGAWPCAVEKEPANPPAMRTSKIYWHLQVDLMYVPVVVYQ